MRRVVFLHGFLGAPDQLAAIAPAAVGIALPGHGRAPWFPRVDTFDAAVDELAARVSAVGEVDVLVGYSMGARLALAALLRRPGIARSALLIGVDAGLEDDEARAARDAVRARRAAILREGGLASFVEAWEREPVFASQVRLSPEILAAQRASRAAHTERGIAWVLDRLDVASQPLLDVRGLTVPVAFLAGARDARFAAIAERLAHRAPGARAVIAPGSGHNLLLEAPDLVEREISRLLTSPGHEPVINQGSPP